MSVAGPRLVAANKKPRGPKLEKHRFSVTSVQATAVT